MTRPDAWVGPTVLCLSEPPEPPPAWLNGWSRMGYADVLVGTAVRCIGCGRARGIIGVAFDEGWEPPGPEPVWPFSEEACPVCALQRHPEPDPPTDPCRVCGGTGERPKVRLP